MKKTGLKRLFALALILVLAFSLSVPAFAGAEEEDAAGTRVYGNDGSHGDPYTYGDPLRPRRLLNL